jgi:hypothetical protein
VKWSQSGCQVSDADSNPKLLLDKHSSQDPFSVGQQNMVLSKKMMAASNPAETRTCNRKHFT